MSVTLLSALPPDIWWLLRVPIAQGACTPFELWITWHYQWLIPREMQA